MALCSLDFVFPVAKGWMTIDEGGKYVPEDSKLIGPRGMSTWKAAENFSPYLEQENFAGSQEGVASPIYLGVQQAESIPYGEGRQTPDQTRNGVRAAMDAGKK